MNKQPLYFHGFCDPKCPFLDEKDFADGICKKDGNPLMFHDGFIAHCPEANEEEL